MASILKVNTIQDATNSNTDMSVDSNGRVTYPQHICFSATRMSGSGSVGVQGTIVFNTDYINKGSGFDTSNGRFTAPIAGIYEFQFQGFGAGNTSGQYLGSGTTFTAKLQKNGSDYAGAIRAYTNESATNYSPFHMSQYLDLDANDYVTINISSSYLYTANDTNDAWNLFSGRLIG